MNLDEVKSNEVELIILETEEGVEYFKAAKPVLKAKFGLFDNFAAENGDTTIITPFVNDHFLNLLKLGSEQIKKLPMTNLEDIYQYLYYSIYLGVKSKVFVEQLLGKIRFATHEQIATGLIHWHLMKNFTKYRQSLERDLVSSIIVEKFDVKPYEKYLSDLTPYHNLIYIRQKLGMDTINCPVGILDKYDFSEVLPIYLYNVDYMSQYNEFISKIYVSQSDIKDIMVYHEKQLLQCVKSAITDRSAIFTPNLLETLEVDKSLLVKLPAVGDKTFKGIDGVTYMMFPVLRPYDLVQRYNVNITYM